MISPELSHYRTSGKGLNRGPRAIVLVGPSIFAINVRLNKLCSSEMVMFNAVGE